MTQGYFGELYPLLAQKSPKSKNANSKAKPSDNKPPAVTLESPGQITVVTWAFGHMLQIEADDQSESLIPEKRRGRKKSKASPPGGSPNMGSLNTGSPNALSPPPPKPSQGANWKVENLPRVPSKFKLVPLASANATQLEVLSILLTKSKRTYCQTLLSPINPSGNFLNFFFFPFPNRNSYRL